MNKVTVWDPSRTTHAAFAHEAAQLAHEYERKQPTTHIPAVVRKMGREQQDSLRWLADQFGCSLADFLTIPDDELVAAIVEQSSLLKHFDALVQEPGVWRGRVLSIVGEGAKRSRPAAETLEAWGRKHPGAEVVATAATLLGAAAQHTWSAASELVSLQKYGRAEKREPFSSEVTHQILIDLRRIPLDALVGEPSYASVVELIAFEHPGAAGYLRAQAGQHYEALDALLRLERAHAHEPVPGFDSALSAATITAEEMQGFLQNEPDDFFFALERLGEAGNAQVGAMFQSALNTTPRAVISLYNTWEKTRTAGLLRMLLSVDLTQHLALAPSDPEAVLAIVMLAYSGHSRAIAELPALSLTDVIARVKRATQPFEEFDAHLAYENLVGWRHPQAVRCLSEVVQANPRIVAHQGPFRRMLDCVIRDFPEAVTAALLAARLGNRLMVPALAAIAKDLRAPTRSNAILALQMLAKENVPGAAEALDQSAEHDGIVN